MNIVNTQIKEELKKLAKDVRFQKRLFKSKQRSNQVTMQDLMNSWKLKHEYRHKHIARCPLRGTPYELIETRVREDNKPNMDLIQKYKEEYQARFEEVSHEEA